MIEDSPGLYIHIPFCRGRCPYCDFYSEHEDGRIPAFIEALCDEAVLYSGVYKPFGSLYVGGGTPSVLSAVDLGRLVDSVRSRLDVQAGAESTVEVNPDDIDRASAAALLDMSFNRISIGVQSFDDRELRFLGRRHDARAAVSAFGSAREAGFDNIGIDLIYGFRGQPPGAWKRNLEKAVELGPEHISCYQLTVHDGTPFGRLAGSGARIDVSEELQREYFLSASRFLTENGYIHYEVSNFARSERFMSSHNMRYWRRAEYLGLGPSAHSLQGSERWWNTSSLDDYIRLVSSGERPLSEKETLTGSQVRLEMLMLGLRSSVGVPLDIMAACPGSEQVLEGLSGKGLVTIRGDRVFPTVDGFLVADALPLLFETG